VVPEDDRRRDAGTSATSQLEAVTGVDDAMMRRLRQRLQLCVAQTIRVYDPRLGLIIVS